MKFKDISINNKYIQEIATDDREKKNRKRARVIKTIYVLQKDELKKQLLVSVNGTPAKWITCRQIARWKKASELIKHP